LDKPRFRVQQAAGLRAKALNKELEQRECPALPTPARSKFSFILSDFLFFSLFFVILWP